MADGVGFDLAAVEALLHEPFGPDVAIVDARRIRPWAVARCRLRGAGAPPSVIVKWLRSNPEGFRVEPRQVATEVAALSLVGRVAPGVAPSLIAHDLGRDLLVTEDLAPHRTLHSVLATGMATAGGVAGLHGFAATMARLHASTAGLDADGPWDDSSRVLVGADDAAAVLARLEPLVPVTAAARHDVAAAVTEIDRPGPLRGFSNGDSGANNCLVDAGGGDARLIDFEHACLRHVLLDAAALHVPGSMWMTVADPVPLGVEATYRTVAGAARPALLDDGCYGFALSAACAVTAVHKLQRLDKLDARPPGHHSRPQLVSTLDRTVATMARWGALDGFGAWLADVARALRRRWPDADVTFPDDYTLREPLDPDLSAGGGAPGRSRPR